MTKTITILRAVSGSGKTTLAKVLEASLPDCVAFAADDYHYDENGNYNWLEENMFKSHQWCQNETEKSMIQEKENIVIHNTNTTAREINPYIKLAEKYDYKIVSLIVENRHGNQNLHNVPEEHLERQENRLKNSIKLR